MYYKKSMPFYSDFEVVERKGEGHPDTLSDGLAEELSRAYSNYTLEHFGVILHHNFDKVGLLGGSSQVSFGKGMMKNPIRVLINGRASNRIGTESIPVKEIIVKTTNRYLKEKLPLIDVEKDLEYHFNLSTASSPGRILTDGDLNGSREYWFSPRSKEDLQERKVLFSNDTSAGCAHYPFSDTENLVLYVEKSLNSKEYKQSRPWLGSDIKIMACRTGTDIDLTICIPQIANYVPDLDAYKANLEEVREYVLTLCHQKFPVYKIQLNTNTRDKYDVPELYLTATGSSIESGDEGLVGRGNRINGTISMCRPFSIEGACGKNPVYHVGKLYNMVAYLIAKDIGENLGTPVEVFIISQSGRELMDPWKVLINYAADSIDEKELNIIVEKNMRSIPDLTKSLIAGDLNIY